MWFDAALTGYLFGVVFAVFGIIYRYTVWLRRPPTAMLNRRGWDAFRQHKTRNAAALPSLVATHLLAQGFIRHRSTSRWLAHQLVFWGCILAALVTFPLTLGLLHFESVGQQADRYQVFVSQVGTLHFDADSIIGWLVFHALDIAASGVVLDWWGLAWALWFVGVAVWPILLYTTLVAVVLGGPKPGLEAGINGTWFLLTVSTESIAVLGALLLRRGDSDVMAFACLALFCLGLVLYLIVMTMVFLRWTFATLEPTEAGPPAWIAAGAVAIVVLAGSNLLLAQDAAPRIARVAPAVEVVVVLAWATATFWFPLMVAIGVWRHVISRVPLRYHPSYWALVFPLGMYGVATSRMVEATGLTALDWLPPVVLAIALTAWTLAFAGLVGTAPRAWRSPVAASGTR